VIKRRGYGFRNFKNFSLRCLLNWHFASWFYMVSSEEPKRAKELVKNAEMEETDKNGFSGWIEEIIQRKSRTL
jgi:hypothetical protein